MRGKNENCYVKVVHGLNWNSNVLCVLIFTLFLFPFSQNFRLEIPAEISVSNERLFCIPSNLTTSLVDVIAHSFMVQLDKKVEMEISVQMGR